MTRVAGAAKRPAPRTSDPGAASPNPDPVEIPLETSAPSASVTDDLPSRESLSEDTDVIRAMWYGDPGFGKTDDLAHMACLGKTIYIDAENRLKAGPLKRRGVPIENIEPVKDCRYEALEALAFEIGERLAKGEEIIGVCWDSATENARQFTQTLVDKGVIKANRAGKERVAWATELADWGDMTEQMRRTIRRFRDLPIHLALSCLASRDTDETGSVRVSPALSPAVYKDFMGYMDVVVHKRTEVLPNQDDPLYFGLCRPSGIYVAKDSFGTMPKILVDPGFDRVLAYVRGDLTSATDPIQTAAKQALVARDTPQETAS